MKKFLFFSLLISIGASAQNMSLSDLQKVFEINSAESANQYLTQKHWIYFDSKINDTNSLCQLSYKEGAPDSINDNGLYGMGDLDLYFSPDNTFGKIHYRPSNKRNAIASIQNEIIENGFFKFKKDSVFANYFITKFYENKDFYLYIETQNNFTPGTFPFYNIVITRKFSYWDIEEKTRSNDDGTFTKFTLKNGELNGNIVSYYPSGELKSIGKYSAGKKHGKWTNFYQNGSTESEMNYNNGKLNGTMITYANDENNIVRKTISNYTDDQLDGKVEMKDINDSTIYFVNYSKGEKNGACHEAIGDSVIIGSYQNGLLNGECKIIYTPTQKANEQLKEYNLFIDENGNVSNKMGDIIEKTLKEAKVTRGANIVSLSATSEGKYVEGKKNGLWETTETFVGIDSIDSYKDRLICKTTYEQGEPVGEYLSYVESRPELATKGQYKNGLRDGNWTTALDDDKAEATFSNGTLKTLSLFDNGSESTVPYAKYEFLHKKLILTQRYEGGMVLQEYNYDNSVDFDNLSLGNLKRLTQDENANGAIEMYENDSLVMSGSMKGIKKVGLWKWFDYKQGVITEQNFDTKYPQKYYNMDKTPYTGKFSINHDKYTEERYIKNGIQNGTTQFIEKTSGKVVKKTKYKNGYEK